MGTFLKNYINVMGGAFFAFHLVLVLIASGRFFWGWSKIRGHVKNLDSKPGADGAGDPNHKSSLGPWKKLQSLYQGQKRPLFAEVRDRYEALIEGYSEDLSRIVNLLLLSGVAGTLYGLYGSTKGAGDSQGWNEAMSTSFGAFGVTFVAIVWAAVVIIMQRQMTSIGNEAEVDISVLWDRRETVDVRDPMEGVNVAVRYLHGLKPQFDSIVASMKQLSEQVASDKENLREIAQSCSSLKTSIEGLPATVSATLTQSQRSYLDAVDVSTQKLKEHQASALVDLNKLAEHVDESHDKYLGGFVHIQNQNVELFAQIRETNKEAFMRLKTDIDNFSRNLRGIEQEAGAFLEKVGERVGDVLSRRLSALESKLETLLNVAPEADRNLQLIGPSSEVARDAIQVVERRSVEMERRSGGAVEAIDHIQRAAKGLADALVGIQAQIQRAISLREAREVPRLESGGGLPPSVNRTPPPSAADLAEPEARPGPSVVSTRLFFAGIVIVCAFEAVVGWVLLQVAK